MSDYLPPLADIGLDEAQAMRGALLRAIGSGSLMVRYADGTAITYRSMAEMRTALTEIEGRITAASGGLTTGGIRAVRMTPSSGWR